jgi:hypothetical protein
LIRQAVPITERAVVNPEPFPGKQPPVKPQSSIKPGAFGGREPLNTLPNVTKPSTECGTLNISPTSSFGRGSYLSQSKLITSKAVELGLQMSGFQQIFSEKNKLAEKKFPGESVDWQTWYGESMIWTLYCKKILARCGRLN